MTEIKPDIEKKKELSEMAKQARSNNLAKARADKQSQIRKQIEDEKKNETQKTIDYDQIAKTLAPKIQKQLIQSEENNDDDDDENQPIYQQPKKQIKNRDSDKIYEMYDMIKEISKQQQKLYMWKKDKRTKPLQSNNQISIPPQTIQPIINNIMPEKQTSKNNMDRIRDVMSRR